MQRRRFHLAAAIIFLATILCISYIYQYKINDLCKFSKAALSYYGSSGQEVIDVQTRLYDWGYYNGIVDGSYGYQTYQAVRNFQAKNGLGIDGIAGSETLAALGLPAGNTTASYNTDYTSNNNVNMLAHLIHGEARGEPYSGQVAVGAVILNRTRDSRFPKTISGVIYEPGAFDAVYDGQINLDPDDIAFRAARDALNGWDPTYGCVYYWNPATATSSWIWSRQIVTQIGRHVFAR